MILALKTSDATAQLWLYGPDETRPAATDSWESGRALADELLPRLEGFLKSHQQDWPDLTGIIIFGGPGSFTSLRIGHSVANALGGSLSIPVLGLTGEDWLETGLREISSAPAGRPALPHYGAEAHITAPAKPTPHQE